MQVKTFFIVLCVIFSKVSLYCSEQFYCEYANKIQYQYARKIKEQKKLFLIGEGGGMMGNIQRFNFFFQSFQEIHLEEARKLYIEIVDEFLTELNSNKEIRPYLDVYPCDLKNLKLKIMFTDYKSNFFEKPALSFIGNIYDKKIYYEAYDSRSNKHSDLVAETYEEAVKVLHNKNDCGA